MKIVKTISIVTAFFMALALVPVKLLAASVTEVPVWDGTTASGFAGGNGTESDPYMIENGSQLAYLVQCVHEGHTYSGKYFRQTNDIRLNNSANWQSWSSNNRPSNEWTPVSENGDCAFGGTYDGQNHWIRGLFTLSEQVNHRSHRSLFGYINGAVIKNVIIEQSCVISKGYGAAIASNAVDSVFLNCVNRGRTYIHDASYGSGIVGFVRNSVITECVNEGTIQAHLSGYIGGIAGDCRNTTVENCTNSGLIDVLKQSMIGGVIGSASEGSIVTGCHNYGSFDTFENGLVGGIVGDGLGCEISGCENTADLDSKNQAGGIASKADSFTLCINRGNVSGSSLASGIGAAQSISNCVNYGNVNGVLFESTGLSPNAAGISTSSVTIVNCVNYGSVSAEYLGSASGIATKALSIIECENHGSVTSERAGASGIIDQFKSGQGKEVTLCKNFGTITCSNIGGAFGICSDDGGTISKCENHGDVFGDGGAVGISSGGHNVIEDCYNTGNISSNNDSGGITTVNMGTISRCYNTGIVSGEVSGAIIIMNNAEGVVENCYYLDTCGESEFGTALTHSQMLNYGSYVGFDFTNVWTMLGSADYPYAELRAYYPDDPQPTPAFPGDANGDGTVGVDDALYTLRVSMGLTALPDDLMTVLDVNEDGSVTLVDALAILRMAMGLA